jgi:hypothetical protein
MESKSGSPDPAPAAAVSRQGDGSGRPAIGLAGRDSLQRALIGFLLAAALFLVEAGFGEITLANNLTCIERLRGIRLPPASSEACVSEFELYLAESFSSGILGVLRAEPPRALAWIVMALLYGLAGAGFAQLQLRQAVIGFFIAHAVLVMILVAVNYLSQFIV